MKIVVIGAGAMGSIYGGRLSQKNEVYLIDTNREIVERINRQGLRLLEQEKELVFHPKARTSAAGIGEADLVILFVKALYSRTALAAAGEVIGENTYVMTLQNGAGLSLKAVHGTTSGPYSMTRPDCLTFWAGMRNSYRSSTLYLLSREISK